MQVISEPLKDDYTKTTNLSPLIVQESKDKVQSKLNKLTNKINCDINKYKLKKKI